MSREPAAMLEDGAMDTELPQRLLVAVALERPPADPRAAVDALARAVEEVVVPAMFVDLDWRTTVITPADDLERGGGRQAAGRWWDLLHGAAGRLESGGIAGLRQDVPHDLLPPDPTVNPVNAVARLLPGRPATLAWSVHRWAVRDWASFVPAAVGWLLDAATSLGAGSGYVTLDVVDAGQHESAWEVVAQVSPAASDFERAVWGYGWGTLLSAEQADAVGGSDRLRQVPGAELLQGPGGHLWVRLSDDPATVDPASVATLRRVLAPVLQVGRRTVEEYVAPRSNPFESPALPYVV
jgi:hypothetical protein